MRTRLVFAFVILASLVCGAQQASLTVVDVDPAEPATLTNQDYVSIHVAYTAPQEVVIWARPYFGGREVTKGISHPSPRYAAGSGEAFGWFQINTPLAVDAIHVKMVEAGGRRVLAEIDHPISVTFSGASGTSRARAAWAVQMSAAQQERFRADAAASRNRPTSAGDAFFGFGFMLVVIGAFVATFAWPAYKAYKWSGLWRWGALLPLIVMGFVVLRIVIDTSRDPTSHNLWPFEIVMFGGGSLIFMALLTAARRFSGQSES
jgi:hypothetical protein